MDDNGLNVILDGRAYVVESDPCLSFVVVLQQGSLCWVKTYCPDYFVTSLDTAVEVSCWGKHGVLDRRYGLNVAQDFLYFRVLRSYKTGIVRVMSFNVKCRHVLIGKQYHSFQRNLTR